MCIWALLFCSYCSRELQLAHGPLYVHALAPAYHAVKEFCKYLVFALETIIYLFAGIIVAVRMLDLTCVITPKNCYKVIGLWALAMGGRLLSLVAFLLFLRKIAYGLSLKQLAIMT